MCRTLFLVRHCAATGQAPDAPLTPSGELQAQALAQCLLGERIERIVSSPFVRAVHSVQPLADRLGLSVETDARLSERVLSGHAREDWRERLSESFVDFDLCLPGGESSRVAMTRGVSVLHEVLDRPQRTVIMTHGNLLTLLLHYFDGTAGFEHFV